MAATGAMKISFGGTPLVAAATIRALSGESLSRAYGFIRHDHRRGAVAELRGIAGRHRALRIEGWLEAGQLFRRRVGTRAFVNLDDRISLAARHGDRHDLLLKGA